MLELSTEVFELPGEWLKGAIHNHTTQSDGRVTPANALATYRDLGFDFLVFGDHRKITTPPDPDGKLVIIPGAEWDAAPPSGPSGYHFMAVDMPDGHEDQILNLRQDPEEMARLLGDLTSFLIIAHPYWSALTTEMLARLSGIAALEVYNHGCELEDALGYSTYAWDQLLARGVKINAVAVDDNHGYSENESGGGYVMVKSESREPASIVAALCNGNYYSSMGPTIKSFSVTPDREVSLQCSPAKSILFRCNGSLGNGNHVATDGEFLTSANHVIPQRACFVRCEVTDEAGRKAWTNPVYFD